MPNLLPHRDLVGWNPWPRVSSAHTINGFQLAGDLPGRVVMLEWPAACLIKARRQLHDGPKLYVASIRRDARLEVLPRLLLKLLLADGGAGPGAWCAAQPLMSMFSEVPMYSIARCKAAFAGGTFPRISLVYIVQDDLSLALPIKSRIIRWNFRSSFLSAAAGGCRWYRCPWDRRPGRNWRW